MFILPFYKLIKEQYVCYIGTNLDLGTIMQYLRTKAMV